MKVKKKKYEINNIDYNEISFIEQSLKRSIEYYNDLNIKRPDKLYKDALKTVSSLCKKIKEVRLSKGEKPEIRVRIPQKNSKQLEFNFSK
jgi:hypothetical protein|tara:strand:+ start:503 stop:772 length:270 start_codon:yes stop_codon:yes gene_type:complete